MNHTGTIWSDVSHDSARDPRDALRRRDTRAADRDVRIPPPADPTRRERYRLDLLGFLRCYLASWFSRQFSEDHLQMIADLQSSILHGDCYVLVAPRGIGKSTIVLGAAIWALLYGHRRCIVILCDTVEHSIDRLDSIRMVIETNELLFADFPGPCACVRALQGNWNRANGQTVRGKRTFIRWGGSRVLCFPMIDGEPSSGACIATKSMKRAVRGLVFSTPDGRQLRPDFALMDDPLDKEDAESAKKVAKIIKKIQYDVMFLGDAGTRIAGTLITTVKARNDDACQFLDPERHPGWLRRRFQLMRSLPDPSTKPLWDTYADLRAKSKSEHGDYRLSNAYYAAHRAAMDTGALSVHAECYDRAAGEHSVIQHALNIIIDEGMDVFLTECQNEPPALDTSALLVLDAYRVERAIIEDLPRGIVPNNALELAFGVDVQKHALYWLALAAAPGRVLTCIDYGIQDVNAPDHARIDPQDTARMQALERAITVALCELRDRVVAEPYRRTDGTLFPVSLAAVDSNYMTTTVRNFCATSSGLFIPIVGHGTLRDQARWYVPKDSQLTRDGNLYLRADAGQAVAHLHTDAYKQIIHTGFLLDAASPGSVRLFAPAHRKDHHTLSHHIASEQQTQKASGPVWEKAKGRAANHYFDAFVYAVATMSLLEHRTPGIGIHGLGQAVAVAANPTGWRQRRPTRISYGDVN